MFIMNEEGMNGLMKGHIKLGADVSAAAGPVGRTASVDAGMKAGILTYSSSKGAFIGASLNGAEIQQDKDATMDWYGKDASFSEILKGDVHTKQRRCRRLRQRGTETLKKPRRCTKAIRRLPLTRVPHFSLPLREVGFSFCGRLPAWVSCSCGSDTPVRRF